MDFKTVERKLHSGEYDHEKNVIFWSDLALIAMNEGTGNMNDF